MFKRPPAPSPASFSDSSEWSTLPPPSRRSRGRGGGGGYGSGRRSSTSSDHGDRGSYSSDYGKSGKNFKTSSGKNVPTPLFEGTKGLKGRGRLARIQEVKEESESGGGARARTGRDDRAVEDGETDEEEEEIIKEKRVLSFHAPSSGNLAAAWYDPEERKIQVLEDTKDTFGWDTACLIIEQVQPQLIVLSSKTLDSLYKKAQIYRTDNPSCEILVLPVKACTVQSAYLNLASIKLPDRSVAKHPVVSSESDELDRSSGYEEEVKDHDAGMGRVRLSLVKLGCWVNVVAPLAIIAAGILVDQVKKSTPAEGATGMQWRPVLALTALESMELDHRMQINQDALTSLAIFDTEAHAFMHNSRPKTALSIFGLLNTAVTPLGRKLLHSWHLRPLVDIDEITARHDAVELLAASENSHIVDSIRRSMKMIRNVPARCTKIRNGNGGYQEWKCLVDGLAAAWEIKNHLVRDLQIQKRVYRVFHDDLLAFTQEMNANIDWDQSKIENRVTIRPGVDAELDAWREEYAGLEAILDHVARIICTQIPLGISRRVNVVYFPQLGYLAVVQADSEGPPSIPGWEPKFRTGDKFYYKTKEMTNLDEHYGDLHIMIVERQIQIVESLITWLQAVELDLLLTIDVIAELDWTYSLVRPTMVEEPVLIIKNGRHLLYETNTAHYIANDTGLEAGLEGEFNSMMVITGANGSGKSAYGKQVALIAFMAQIGSFVPAEGAVIGICDKSKYAHTRESSSRHGSAFMIDLGQVSQALRGATHRSLIILDEFGKGTTSTDGAGLLAGVIEHLLEKNGPCPRTVILTHFHELFARQFLSDQLWINFCQMETIKVAGTNDIQYLYKLGPRTSGTSYAADCALRHGIPKAIVERAKYVTECVSRYQVSKLFDSTMTEEQKRNMQAAEQLARLFLTWDIDPEVEDVRDKMMDMLEETDPEVKEEDEEEDGAQPEVLDHDEDEGGDDNMDGESVEPSEDGM
ncbi:hypothetical protein CI109_107110 [Kwoniella shandongensis]|uniref:DNA mismatch repair proteins mutS family domain-containing protein n=1 Tax=Kwoniella shandongensis TaxID=1734106 RepID=A0AAJ8N0Z9_9TREE